MISPISLPPETAPLSDGTQPSQAPERADARPNEASFYYSPVVRIDPVSETVIWVFRNAETGSTTGQYPSELTVQAYRQAAYQYGHLTDLKAAESAPAREAASRAGTMTVIKTEAAIVDLQRSKSTIA